MVVYLPLYVKIVWLSPSWHTRCRWMKREETISLTYGPESLAILLSDAGKAVLGYCGWRPGLFEVSGSGQGSREVWRPFVYGAVQPVAALVSEELSQKLETDVSLNFTELQAHDLTGRATSFKKLVEGGMEPGKAAGISGLMALKSV